MGHTSVKYMTIASVARESTIILEACCMAEVVQCKGQVDTVANLTLGRSPHHVAWHGELVDWAWRSRLPPIPESPYIIPKGLEIVAGEYHISPTQYRTRT